MAVVLARVTNTHSSDVNGASSHCDLGLGDESDDEDADMDNKPSPGSLSASSAAAADADTPRSTTSSMSSNGSTVGSAVDFSTPAAAARNVAVTIEELQREDVQTRTTALRRIAKVAQALGPERTRKELVPFLNGAFVCGCYTFARVNDIVRCHYEVEYHF